MRVERVTNLREQRTLLTHNVWQCDAGAVTNRIGDRVDCDSFKKSRPLNSLRKPSVAPERNDSSSCERALWDYPFRSICNSEENSPEVPGERYRVYDSVVPMLQQRIRGQA